MRKRLLWTLLPLLALTACSLNLGAAGSIQSNAGMELPEQTKLILGIVKLEETENAVAAEQAKELLPMFYVLRNLNESDSAAQEEIDGLTNQIKETLTKEQLQAIEAMSLSPQDMMSLMQGGGGNRQDSASASSGSAGGPPDMGGMPGGMSAPPEMGGAFGGGSQTTSSANADKTTNRAAVISTGTPSALFDALIKLLEKKIK